MVSSTTLHAEPGVGLAKCVEQPGGNHVALLTVMSAVAPLPPCACAGTPISPVGNGGLSGVESAEPMGHEHAAMTTPTAAAALTNCARIASGYPQRCLEKRGALSTVRVSSTAAARSVFLRVPRTYDSNMHSIEVPEEVSAALDAQDAADAALRGLDFEALSPTIRLRVLERMEASRRRQVAVSHDIIAGLASEDPADIGGPVHKVVADWLRISYAEACRRLRDAADMSPRLTLTGQELPPQLPATAVAWHDGALDGQHLRVIQTFVPDLPESIPAATVEDAERFLAGQARTLRPDQLQKLAHQCALRINPDGKFSDADRARQRGFTWCGQRADGMSIGKLIASPELRANLDAWLSRFAAPGVCNPDDQTPCVAGEPDDEQVRTDTRSPAQRQHDALNALVRGQLGDPKLGQHNGLPVTVIVSTTLQELTSAGGRAVTGGGTLLPMPDVIRMARHAYHYLA